MEIPRRKTIRLKSFDYSTPGYYFVTICTKEKQKLLGEIVGTGLPDGPKINLSGYGRVAQRQVEIMAEFYDDLRVEKYVIMPNHIHFLICVLGDFAPDKNGVPTNSSVSKFVGTFKRFCNRTYGKNIWQSRSYDHVIRGEADYREIWQYIEENPLKWTMDRFYTE